MLTLNSPAKINLFLQILHKRTDGYHELASIFQAISLCDTLKFELSNVDQFTSSEVSLINNPSNLIIKALNLFRQKTGLNFYVNIHLEKKIPMQAGLGGGSSNAATTLFGLNTLLNKPLSDHDLLELSGLIGSDVPFFFSKGSAFCRGRGEIIENIPSLPNAKVTLIKPKQGLSTPLVFKNFDSNDASKKDPIKVVEGFLNGNADYFNDLEPAAFRVFPELKNLKDGLKNDGFSTVLMSGSGSCFFCLGNVKNKLQNDFSLSCEAYFLNRRENNWYDKF